MHELLTLAVIYAGAGLLHGVLGFGFALISVPLVAGLYDVPVAVAMNAIVGTANCAYKAWLLRRHIEYRRVLRFFIVAAASVPVGVIAVSSVPQGPAMAVLGLFVVVVAIANLVSRERVVSFMRRRRSFWGLACLTGLTAGAFGTPGPTSVPYFVGQTGHAQTAKANLQMFFTLVAIPVFVFHAFAGNITVTAIGRAAVFVPLVLLVTLAGTMLAGRIRRETLSRVVDAGLVGLGIWIIIENIVM